MSYYSFNHLTCFSQRVILVTQLHQSHIYFVTLIINPALSIKIYFYYLCMMNVYCERSLKANGYTRDNLIHSSL